MKTDYYMNSKMTHLEHNSEAFAWLDEPSFAIEHNFVSAEEMEGAAIAYREFLCELDKEWPPERVKELALGLKREQYARAARYILDLELKNKDARTAGVSYKEREEKYAKKIRMGHRVIQEYKEEGKAMKSQDFVASSHVAPLDMESVKRDGFEKYLVNTGLFGYPQVGPKDLTLTGQTDTLRELRS